MQTLIRKKAGLALSMSEKADLRTRKITSSKEENFTVKNGATTQEENNFKCICS